MIIVSQDKNTIVNIDNVSEIRIVGGGVSSICHTTTDGRLDDGLLGSYRSEERSREVLQEIVNEYRKYLSADGLCGVRGYPPFAYTQPKVYEMPEE
jgi:hypothetical protein